MSGLLFPNPLGGPIRLGIIGGTSVYKIEGLVNVHELTIPTPFGTPSDRIIIGNLSTTGISVAFLPRHGRSHSILPSEINFRANIYALKLLGVEYLLSVSAVGSLADENRPRDVVLVDQLIDRTRSRRDSFFGEGCVAHVGFAHPVCDSFKAIVEKAASRALENNAVGSRLHTNGTYVCIDGPAFSTRAESFSYKAMGGTVIGMTAYQEAKLAREAEMAYAIVALVTDYDGWHPDHAAVTVDMVMGNLKAIGSLAQEIVRELVVMVDVAGFPESEAHSALKFAIMTSKDKVPEQTAQRLALLANKYWSVQENAAANH
eukprot:ANDGO_08002.mRNA.1 S-methyl-5'-thioadenosine phosphorylase